MTRHSKCWELQQKSDKLRHCLPHPSRFQTLPVPFHIHTLYFESGEKPFIYRYFYPLSMSGNTFTDSVLNWRHLSVSVYKSLRMSSNLLCYCRLWPSLVAHLGWHCWRREFDSEIITNTFVTITALAARLLIVWQWLEEESFNLSHILLSNLSSTEHEQ